MGEGRSVSSVGSPATCRVPTGWRGEAQPPKQGHGSSGEDPCLLAGELPPPSVPAGPVEGGTGADREQLWVVGLWVGRCWLQVWLGRCLGWQPGGRRGAGGVPKPLSTLYQGGWSPHWPLLLFPVVTQNGPAGPAWSELAQLCTFQGGAHQGIDARGGGALQGGVWGEQVGDSLAGGWALARAEAGTLPHLCHYRNPEGLLGSQQSCLLVSPFPSGPSTPHRPSCACCPSLAPLPAPAGDLLGPRGAGGRWGWASTPSWFCPSFCRASSKTSPWFTGNVALTPWLMGHTGAKKTPVEGGAGVCCGH